MKRTVYSTLALLFLLVQSIFAQDNFNEFFSNNHGITGLDGAVTTITQTLEGETYIGGEFIWYNGTTRLDGIAKYDPLTQKWVPVGQGLGWFVRDIAEYKGELFAGGYFQDVDGGINYIAKFDEETNSWKSFDGSINWRVHSLTVINDTLFATGLFPDNIRYYSEIDNSWKTLPSDPQFEGNIEATLFHKNKLYVGGFVRSVTNNVAAKESVKGVVYLDYETGIWKQLGTNLDGYINDLIIFEDELYTVGSFTEFDNSGFFIANRSVAKWDTTSLKWMFFDNFESSPNDWLNGFDLVEHQGELIKLGTFQQSDGNVINGIARLDSNKNNWIPISTLLPDEGMMMSAFSNGTELIFGGEFYYKEVAKNIAMINTTGLVGFGDLDLQRKGGSHGSPLVLGVFKNDLVYSARTASNLSTQISTYNLETGTTKFSSNTFNNYIRKLIERSGQLYIGGAFDQIDETDVGGIVYLTEMDDWEQVGDGLDRSAIWDALFYNDQLVVAGSIDFNKTDFETELNNIAIFNSIENKFEPFGDGLNGFVSSLEVFESELYAGGYFDQSGDSPVLYVAKWDSASRTWENLNNSGVLNNWILDMTTYNNELLVAGLFSISSDKDSSMVAKWNSDNQNWEQVGSGVRFGEVRAFENYNDKLYIGGFFKMENSDKWCAIAYLDVESQIWKCLDFSMEGIVSDMMIYQNKLYIVGDFHTAGGKAAAHITSFIDPTLVSNEEFEALTSFRLLQNYPNPFNPTTNINFNLPAAGYIKLEVFDVLGRKVAELANEHLNSGSHSILFDAGNLASGLYVYRLEANNQVLTKKMTLIK